MALTTEILRGNATLAGLTDEQVSAIAEMSRNDEAAVIGQKTGEIYGGLDADILASSGIPKNGTEKTYDYAKRAIGQLKEEAAKVTELTSQVASLTKEQTRLQGIIDAGGADEETKKQLRQARADLTNVTKSYTDLQSKYDTEKAQHEKDLLNLRLDNELTGASAGLKFRADLPKAVTEVLLRQAIEKVKGMNPEYIDDGKGGKVLAFMENGTPMRNAANNLNPYTAGELIARELTNLGVLDAGRTQTGTGTGKEQPRTTTTTEGETVVDISTARTQTEASNIIARALMQQGLVRGSEAYQKAFGEAWKNGNVKSLPVK